MAVLALVLLGWGVRSLVVSDTSQGQGQASSQDGSGQDSDNAGSEDGGGSGEEGVPDMNEGESNQGTTAEQESAAAEANTDEQVEDADAPEALAQCHARVAAGNAWAAATATSAAHWKQHYMASVRYNAGEISLQRAEAEFAESKAPGEADMEAVRQADAAYSEHEGACADLSVDDLPESWAEEAQQCLARDEAIDDVVATGTEVNSDWSHHLQMMRNKDEADPEAYMKRWRTMVEDAPDAMEPYEEATSELEQAPACSV
ncbi:MAG: hypothetical protein WA892_00950 [Ornithinimicrobium sp.]